MSKYRRAAKIDENQPEIVKGLSIPGVSVQVGHDDILVGYRGKTYWFEIKTEGCKSKKTKKILDSKKKDSQITLEKTWTGHYKIVTTIEEILREIGIMKSGDNKVRGRT